MKVTITATGLPGSPMNGTRPTWPSASVFHSRTTNSAISRQLRPTIQAETPAMTINKRMIVTCVLGTILNMLNIHEAYPTVRMPNGMAMLAPRSRKLGRR